MLIVSTDVECDEPDCLQWVPTVFGSYTFKPGRASFSLRWVIGWVMW